MPHISDKAFAKIIFDDIVDSRYSFLFVDMSEEEKYALRNLYVSNASNIVFELKNEIERYRNNVKKRYNYIVHYHLPHSEGKTDMFSDWQKALEEVVKIYHTVPRAIIEIYDAKDDKRYTHDMLVNIIKEYYVVSQSLDGRPINTTTSFLTIKGQSVNAYNAWLSIYGENEGHTTEEELDEKLTIDFESPKTGRIYHISKHEMK